MTRTIKILLQTTTPAEENNWSTRSFSLLADHLASLRSEECRFEVTVRDRETAPGQDDAVLSGLDRSSYEQLWLFALDGGEGLTRADCDGILRFHRRGGGILAARDHQDMGTSLCALGRIGAAHHFHSSHPEADPERLCRDDEGTPTISWPNYHSGRNGDYHRIARLEPESELLRNPRSPSGWIEFFPSHPHEGAIGAPPGEDARVIAMGTSQSTGRSFNLVVAFESKEVDGARLGRGIAESSFHHFADYNWDTSRGCPSFVTEPEGDGMKREPRALDDIRQYVRNVAFWLGPS